MLFRRARGSGEPSPSPAPNLCALRGTKSSLALVESTESVHGGEAMDTAQHCIAQLAICRRLQPSAKNEAEATVLKNLVRSWKMIANQIRLYEALIDDQK
jgi:hypothetical protein